MSIDPSWPPRRTSSPQAAIAIRAAAQIAAASAVVGLPDVERFCRVRPTRPREPLALAGRWSRVIASLPDDEPGLAATWLSILRCGPVAASAITRHDMTMPAVDPSELRAREILTGRVLAGVEIAGMPGDDILVAEAMELMVHRRDAHTFTIRSWSMIASLTQQLLDGLGCSLESVRHLEAHMPTLGWSYRTPYHLPVEAPSADERRGESSTEHVEDTTVKARVQRPGAKRLPGERQAKKTAATPTKARRVAAAM